MFIPIGSTYDVRMTRLKVCASILLAIAMTTLAKDPPDFSNAARIRAHNYVRRGWFLVDGLWARPQGTFAMNDLFTLNTDAGPDRLICLNDPKIEPLLKDWRTSLIQLNGSVFGWKLSAPRRVWNDTHTGGTQNLLLVAATDMMSFSAKPQLTKIEITPQQQVIQAVRLDGETPISIIIVLGQNFVEASAGPFNAAPQLLIHSTSLRQLLIDRPTEVRRDVIPVLRLIDHGDNPLAPAAGDVYRAFPDLPKSAEGIAAINALVPNLSSREPAIRQHASEQLRAMGRPAVRAALQMDLDNLPPEVADRISAFIADNTRDARSADVLQHDASFLLDCLSDPDPDVRAAAGANVEK